MRFCDSRFAGLFVGVLLFAGLARGQEPAKPSQYTYLEGHKAAVYAVAYTPDGKTILSGSVDGTINVYDAATGKLIRSIREGTGPVLSLAVTRDNLRFAAAGIDRKVRLFDVPSTNPVQVIPSVPGVGWSVAVSPDARLLFTGDASRTLRLWNVDNGAALRDFAGSTGEITGIAILPETRTVLATSREGALRSWNIDNATAGPAFLMPSANSLSADLEGKRLAVAGEDGVVRIVGWPFQLPINFASHGDQVTSVAVSADGQWVLTGALDSQLVIAKGADGTGPRGLPGQSGKVASVALSPDGKLAASGSDTGLVRFWNAADGVDRGVIGAHVGAIFGLAFHPEKPLIASTGADGTVRLWRVPAPSRQLPGHTAPLQLVATTQDGALAATASADKSVRLYKTADGASVRAIEQLPQPATALALSNDGKRLAFGDAGGTIRIENAADGKGLVTLGGHLAPVSGLAFHPDGKRLVSAGQDGSLKVWTIPTAPTATLATHETPTQAVAVAHDGSLVLSGSADGQVRLIDPAKKDAAKTLEGKLGPVTAAAFNSDKTLAAAADNTGLVRFWSPADGSPRLSVAGHPGAVNAIQFAPVKLGQFATAGADGTVRVWRYPVAPVPLAAHKKPIQAAAVSGDGKLALTGGADGLAQLWTLADSKAGKVLVGSEAALHSVALKKDANEAATGDATGLLRLYNPVDGMLRAVVGAHEGPVTGVALHPSQPLAATVGADGVVKLWQLPIAPTAELVKHTDAVTAVALSTDGATAISASADKTIKVHAAGGVRQLGPNFVTPVRSLALSADNAWVAAGTDAGEVRLLNVADGAVKALFAGHTGATTSVAISPNGQLVASVGADGTLRVWETATVAPVNLAGHTKPITATALSPNGAWLATAAGDNTVRLWNASNNAAGPVLSGHTGPVTSVAWKADSNQLVTGSADKTVRLWSAADGKQVALFEGSTGPVNAVAITPDGAKVLGGGAEKAIRTWTVADMKALDTIAGHTADITALALIGNGATIVSGSADGTVRTWTLADGKPALNVNAGSPVAALALSADEKLVAAGGADKIVRLFNAADLKPAAVPQLTGPAMPISGLSFSRDNLRVAAASADGAVRVWTVAGQPLESVAVEKVVPTTVAFGADPRTLYVGGSDNNARTVKLGLARAVAASPMAVHSVAFTTDGNGLITGAADKTVKYWNTADLAAVRAYEGATDAVTGVAVTKDGQKVIASSADKSVRIYAIGGPQPVLAIPHPAAVRSLQPSADNLRLVTGADDNTVRVIDLATGKLVQSFAEATKPVVSVAFAGDGKSVVSGSADFSVRRATISLKAIVPAGHVGGATCVAFNHDGSSLLSGGADKLVRLFDLNGAPVRQFTAEAPVKSLAVRPDGVQITAGCDNAHFYQFTFANAALERKVPTPAVANSVAYSTDNTRLAVAGADNHIRIYQPVDGVLLEDVTAPAASTSIAFGADAGTLVSGDVDNAARVHALALVRALPGHVGGATAVAWAPDGTTLFSGGVDKAIVHWNLTTGQPVRPFPGHTEVISGLGVSADGARLISASPDKTLRTWTIANGAVATTIPVPTPIRTLSVSTDGNRASATADDNIVRVWDLVAAREVEHAAGHEGGTTRVALSGDGKTVASTGADKTVRGWALSADVVVAADPMKIHDLALLADGSHVVTGGEDKLVKLWDLTGKLVRQYGGPAAPVRNVAVSRDGALIAAGGDPLYTQPQLTVWKLADAGVTLNATLASPITSLAFNAEGRVAAGCADKHVRIYSAADGFALEDSTYAPVLFDLAFLPDNQTFLGAGNDNFGHIASTSLAQILKGHTGIVRSAAFVGGDQLITCGDDKTIRQWTMADGKPVRTYGGATAAVLGVSVSKDGKLLAAGGAEIGTRLYTIPAAEDKTAEVAATLTFTHPAAITGLSLTADGTRLATSCNDGFGRIWDTRTGKELERLAGHAGVVNAVAMAADGRFVVTGGADRIGRRWVPAVLAGIPAHEGRAADAKLSADGTRVFTAGADKTAAEFDVATGKLVRRYEGAEAPLRSISLTPDGKTLVAGSDDMTVRLWNTADGKPIASVKTPDIVTSVLAAGGTKKIVATGNDKIVRTFALVTADDKPALESIFEGTGHTLPVVAAALAGDDHTLYTLSADQTIRRWHAASYSATHTLEGNKGPVYALDFSPDNKFLAAAGADKTVRVWNTADGKPAFAANGHTRPVNAVAFSPNGKELASAGLDGTVRLWNAVVPEPPKEGAKPEEKKPDAAGEPGAPVGEITEEIDGPVFALLWSRDGNYLFSAGAARTWQSWLRKDLKLQKSFPGHNQTIYRMTYNPSGTRFATLDYSGQFMVWNTGDGALVYHQQLPAATGYSFAYAPTGTEIVVGTSDARVIRVALPPAAQ